MAGIDYGKIITRSIEISKKNKWLWIFGLALVIYGGGASFRGGGSDISDAAKGIFKQYSTDMPEDLPGKATQVLSATTDIVRDWFANVPLSTWMLITTGIILTVIIWMVLSWIIHAWAKAALIHGVSEADKGQQVTLLNCSPLGIAKIKHLVIFSFISVIITLGSITGTLVILGLVYLLLFFSEPLQMTWLILGSIAAVLTIFILLILFAMLTAYAERLIVLANYAPWMAWKKGLSLAKHNFIPTMVMGLLNMIISASIGCLSTIITLAVLAIPAGILLFPMFTGGFHIPGIATIIGLLFLFTVFILANYIISAVLTVFKYSNWTLLYKEVIKRENLA